MLIIFKRLISLPHDISIMGSLGLLLPSSHSFKEKEMATYSSILAWRIPWTEEPGGLQSMGSQELDMPEPLNHQPPLFLTQVNRVTTPGETTHQYGGGDGRVWWILASENFCLDMAHGTFTHISLTKVSQMTTTIF